MEMQSKIETIIQKYEGQVGQLNHDLGIERSKAENYWEELEHLRSKSLKHDDLRQVEIKLLEDSVKAAKAQIKSKDDEVNHLKNMELKHEKERANRLEEKILEMGKAYENCEMDGAMVVDDLNNKLVIAADKHAKLEEDKSLVISESKKSIGILEAKIRAFETNFVTLKRELTSKTSQIATLEDMIRELSNEKNAQDHNVDQWKGDLDKLINAYEQCKTDHAVTVRSLQADYNDFKKKAQHDASLFQQDYDSLQRLAAETEGKFDRQSNELNATYKELEEKKVVIQEMIDSQRSNDHEMKEARAVIAELQDASDSVGKHAEQYRRRYQDLQLQFETEVNKHIDEIQHRDLTRKEMDRKMKKLEKEIQTLRTELKSTEELRAANYLLQDKVDRQEKFLMRKLEKEKKHRMFPVPTSTAQRSDRSRSVSRQPSDVSKIQNSSSSTRSRSHSTNRQPPRAGDELDDLLA
jgi:chromosome segregation ATPase